MFVFGVFLAGIGLVIFAKQGGITYRGSFTSIVAAVGIFNQSLIVPFYEEITVRTFLFFGIAKYLGFVLSSVAGSVLFGLAHGNISIFAFFVSVLLCYIAYRRVGVFDRTVLHGSYNFVLIILVFVFGRV
jgi:membrane protease YdiL (CAAX protease family)